MSFVTTEIQGAVAAPKFLIKIVPLAAHLHSSFFSIHYYF